MIRSPSHRPVGDRWQRPRRGRSLLPVAVLAVCSAGALADSVKLGGFWFNDVKARDVIDGKLVYIAPDGTERIRPLADLQGLKLTAFSESEAAYEALEAEDHEQALESFAAIAAKTRRPWVKHWALWHKVIALDKLDRPVEAVEAYLKLVRGKADRHFLANPPLASLQAAPDARRKDIASRLRGVRRTLTKGAAREPLERMLELLEAERKPNDAELAAVDSTEAGSAVVTTIALDAADPVTRLLHEGRFEEALAETTTRLGGKEPRMAMRLYQRGLAQLQLALPSDDRRLYLDAGLSFMRVAVYFPKSSYAGPALVEAGVVHEKIGRHKLAVKLWRKAHVEIDPDTDPAVAERLVKMLSGARR